jgi:hypothetical protein
VRELLLVELPVEKVRGAVKVVGDEAAVWAVTEKMATAKKKNSLDIALEAMIARVEQQYSKLRQKTQDTNWQREGRSRYCTLRSRSHHLSTANFLKRHQGTWAV